MTGRVYGRALGVAAIMLATPATAQAHLVNTGLGPFYDGVSHFALTPEDVVPAVALALLAGLRGTRAGRLVLFTLPASWLAGGLVGLDVPLLGTATLVTTVSFLVLGGLVAADAPLPPRWIAGLALALGVLHGGANGAAMAQARLGALGLVGVTSAIFVVVALVAALVVALRAPSARIAVRVAGSWIAATGLLLLGWSLRAT